MFRNINSSPIEIEKLVEWLISQLQDCLQLDLVGIYLFGSLTYDAFDSRRSDIDLVVVTKELVNSDQILQLEKVHKDLMEKYPEWGQRIEISYTPVEMFQEMQPPAIPRPYFGEGRFYHQAQYGNEWLINNKLLYDFGQTLNGQPVRNVVPNIPSALIVKAVKQDLVTEWKPKLEDADYLSNPHYQSYLVLNLCRILYTLKTHTLGSKQLSCAWVKEHYLQWQELITAAETWQYGQNFPHDATTKDFLKFVVEEAQE